MAVVCLRGAEDEGGDSAMLVVFDLDEARLVASRRFGVGAVNSLLNHVMLPSNELVTVTASEVTVIDLEDDRQSRSGARGTVQVGGGSIAFVTAQVDSDVEADNSAARWLGDPTGGRLVASGSNLLVMADPRQAGRHDAMVIDLIRIQPRRVVDLETGESAEMLLLGGATDETDIDVDLLPRKYRLRYERAQQLERRGRLNELADSGVTGIRIWTDGARIYVGGRRGLRAYDLRAPDGDIGPIWSRANDALTAQQDPATNLDLLLSKDVALLIDAPMSNGDADAPPSGVRVTPFSRLMFENRESGLDGAELNLRSGIAGLHAMPEQIHAMNGGLAILDESQRLIFLPGRGK